MEQTQLSKEHLRNSYKKYVVEHKRKPSSLKILSEFSGLADDDFRSLYDSLKTLEQDIWAHYYRTTLEVLTGDSNFHTFSLPEKHLAFLYTLVEVMSDERDFISFMLNRQLGLLLSVYLVHTRTVIRDAGADWLTGGAASMTHIATLSEDVYVTTLWQHSIWTLSFWIKDESEDLQDTDVFIEKTANFLFNATDLSGVYESLDLGKFLISRSKFLSKWIK